MSMGPLGQWDMLRFDPQSSHISFKKTCLGNNFCGRSLPIADSSRAVVSFWRKYRHLVLVNINYLGDLVMKFSTTS